MPVAGFSARVGLSLAVFAAADPARISKSELELKVSSIGPSNPLPGFVWQQLGKEGSASEYAGPYRGGLGKAQTWIPSDRMDANDEAIWHEADEDGVCRNSSCFSPDMRVPLLPWTRQDRWGCERTPTVVPAILVETSELRVSVTPQYGGRLWSVFHKASGREMFMRNPAMQPADFATRKAWTSGGVEWNWSPGRIGHSVFTLEPVWAGVVRTERGDLLRVWEFERINHTTWQVDIFVESDTLWVHPRVDNSNDEALNGYWWTNAAHVITPEGRERVVMPAKYDVEHSEWPSGNFFLQTADVGMYRGAEDQSNFSGVDGNWRHDYSFVGNRPVGQDYFARLCDEEDSRKGVGPAHCAAVPVRNPKLAYIAHARKDGFTTFHGHRGEGTKFYLHAAPQGDNFIQDFMAGVSDGAAGEGHYMEAQTGVAPTQMHVFPVPPRSQVEWTEWFKAFQAAPSSIFSSNYTRAIEYTEESSSRPVSEVLSVGLPWGALHELLLGRKLAPQLPFTLDAFDAGTLRSMGVAPWAELLQDGTFSEATLRRLPGSFEVSPLWYERLMRSSVESSTWLHELLLGTVDLERGHAMNARRRLEASMRLKANPHAARALALLAEPEAAWEWYLAAFEAAVDWDPEDPLRAATVDAVAREVAEFALSTGRLEAFNQSVLPRVPPEARTSDALQLVLIDEALARGDWSAACESLERGCWPTYIQSRRKDLEERWWSVLRQRYEQRAGKKLTLSDLHRIRLRHGLARSLGGAGGSCSADVARDRRGARLLDS